MIVAALGRLAVLCLVLVVWPAAAHACSCARQDSSLEARLQRATLVMAVRVVSTRLVDENALRSDVEAGVKILEVLKGDAAGVKSLMAASHNCGLPLRAGRFYLIVADSPDARETLSICGGSRELGGLPRRDMQYDAIRRYLRSGKPIHRCDAWSVVPPPPTGGWERDVCFLRERAWHRVWREHPLSPQAGT